MTGDPAAARWCAELAAALLTASERTARLAVMIAEDWLDDHGREWAEQAALLQRELDRSAAEAADLGAQMTEPGPVPAHLPLVAGGTSRRGPRLGGTAGTHVDHEYGMSIAELPPG
jgi:hypothetical protein